uniref:FRAT regulator of WNT signaling pathway 2 n=1 Tax=Bos indicus x Bos taurus TaxID=30522 RepID=A0A4W2HBD2_BOBOX
MPCRREEEEEAGEEEEEEEDSILLLEQSVTVGGSVEVDRLVAQIGETLQLDAAQDRPASACAPPGPPLQPPRPPAAVRADKARAPAQPLLLPAVSVEAGGPAPSGALRCALGDRGRVRGRAAPYFVAELATGASTLPGPCRRGWLRGAVTSRRLPQRRWPPAGARANDDDPHRLLQQLVLSGNLIKEAVRRLQPRGLRGEGGSCTGADRGPRSWRWGSFACNCSRREWSLRTASLMRFPESTSCCRSRCGSSSPLRAGGCSPRRCWRRREAAASRSQPRRQGPDRGCGEPRLSAPKGPSRLG